MNSSPRSRVMSFLLKVLWPDRMRHQILVLLVASGLFIVATGAVVFFAFKRDYDRNSPVMSSHLISVAVAKLNETPAAERAAMVDLLQADLPDMTLELVTEEALLRDGGASDGKRFGPFVTGKTLLGMRIEHVLGPRERGGKQPPLVYVRLQDGALLAAEWGTRAPPPPVLGPPFYLFVGFLVLSFCGLMIWAARSLVGPLAELARSASTFGETSTTPVPIREGGPKEVRAAANAFNRMQLRINDVLDKRTRMLAAVSHDLRTPLTRLRLRLDLLEKGDLRDKSLQDLRLMEQQIDSALTFLRDGATSEPVQRIDLPSFLQSVSDQYADMGQDVACHFDGPLAVMARSTELNRALCNLVDNALNYANGAEISAHRTAETIVIDVIDHGPGIAIDDRKRLLEPFERGDAARQIREGTGFGLGLPTAKSIVEAAGGSLELLRTEGGGLTVRLSLPAAGVA